MSSNSINEVTRVAVIGSGAMGRGIAYCALAAGYVVAIADVSADRNREAAQWIAQRAVRDNLQNRTVRAAATIQEACAGGDLIIEAVVENLEAKIAVLSLAAAVAAPEAVLATNTSGLSVSVIGTRVGTPARTVGMHFFNPVPRMRLCEIVVGRETSARTVEVATEVAQRMGKTAVRTGDTPGFLASRLNCALGNEALRMFEQGVATAESIDTAAKLGLNHPLGPLELLDLVGLDVRLAALTTLNDAFGGGFAPTSIHRKLVEEGRLGVKSGGGIYRYDANGKRLAASDGGER